MNKEKEYIEPEILKGNDEKSFKKKASDFGRDYATEKATEQMNDMKKAMFVKGWTLLLPYIFGIILFLFIIFSIIFWIFDTPFDWIFAGLLAFFIARGVLNIKNMFGGKK